MTDGPIRTTRRGQLQGVLAHELSHVKNLDIRFMTLMAVLVGTRNHDLIRKLQPDCLVNSRIVESSDGNPDFPGLYDYYSMGDHKTHPPEGGMYWESTISMHGYYGVDYRPKAEKRWRKPGVLRQQIVGCVAHNGNFRWHGARQSVFHPRSRRG